MLFKIKILIRLPLFIIGLVLVISCNSKVSEKLQQVDYVGRLEVENNKFLPFNFSVKNLTKGLPIRDTTAAIIM